jgi:phosphoribosyl-ATP pyrophosphohydrolase/phosphoribosyl-AMP cyclohydrolase
MNLDFKKLDGLIPAVIQDTNTLKVLMVGFMNEEAFTKTRETGNVTFFSRTKNRLWTKGEESGNFLNVEEIISDCDNDTLLIKAIPVGPSCHTGSDTCFNEENNQEFGFLSKLEKVIQDRKLNPTGKSYTASLFEKGINKITQKVGEEAVETVIAALNESDDDFINEASDLLYHLLVLFAEKNISLDQILTNLESRQN